MYSFLQRVLSSRFVSLQRPGRRCVWLPAAAAALVLTLGTGGAGSAGVSVQAHWVLRDLGVWSGGRNSEAVAINERGQVLVVSETARRVAVGDKVLPVKRAFLWEKGRLRDLGARFGGPGSWGSAINGRGQVVGQADTRAIAKSGHRVTHAFLWEDGRLRDLGALGKPDLAGGESSYALALNAHGQVVGASCPDVGTRCRAFLWQNGKLTALDTLGGLYSEAVAINGRGQIVGIATRKGLGKNGSPIRRAFLWQHGTMRDLGTLGGPRSFAAAINEQGQVVGSADTKAKSKRGWAVGSPIAHAFLWRNGRMRDLGSLGGEYSQALALTERGQVIGSAATKTGAFHAFLWSDGRMRDLGTLGGANSQPTAINERGQIVGWATSTERNTKGFQVAHAFLWENGTMSDLGTLGGRSVASAINENDQIIGWSDTKSGARHAVLWTRQPDS